MTDDALAVSTVAVTQIEIDARAQMEASVADPIERDAAMGAMRQAGSLRRSLEQWIVIRATKAQRAAVTR